MSSFPRFREVCSSVLQTNGVAPDFRGDLKVRKGLSAASRCCCTTLSGRFPADADLQELFVIWSQSKAMAAYLSADCVEVTDKLHGAEAEACSDYRWNSPAYWMEISSGRIDDALGVRLILARWLTIHQQSC